MRPLVGLLILNLGVLAADAPGATFTKEYNPWPVIATDGDTIALPFWGGINSPKPSLVDFDGDGKLDLMVGEVIGKVSYFHNTGTVAQPIWTPVQERLGGLDARTWHRLCDIDADGDPDLFTDAGNNRTSFYRNESVGESIVFTFETDSLSYVIDTTLIVHPPVVDTIVDTIVGFQTGVNTTGDFADLDGDGDFDFFYGNPTGNLWFYRNVGDAAHPSFFWHPDSLRFTFYDSVFAFPGGKSMAEPQHGFSSISLADIDDDNDFDLFWGDINNPSTYYYENLGTTVQSDLTKITETYLPISTLALNHTAFGDLDGDGDLDMIVGAANGQDINCLLLLRNAGTPQNAFWIVEDSNVIKNIDVGSHAVPTFGDLDADGDLDVLLGRGDGRLTHIQNIGSANNPVWRIATNFYKSIDIGLTSSPELVDWDDDGDLDLFIGTESGRIEYWRNDGTAAVFAPVRVTGTFSSISVDLWANVKAVDWNDDGLRDLIVGEWDFNGFANVRLYRNPGPPGTTTVNLVTSTLLKRAQRDFTLPTVVDWDCDGKKDLLVGGNSFGVAVYRNTAPDGTFPDSLTLLAQTDTIPGADDGHRLAFALADADGDRDQDVWLGEENGGLNFHRRDGAQCVCTRHGNPNGDAVVDVLDVVATVAVAFRGGRSIADTGCCPHISRVDNNCDCIVSVQDVVAIVAFVFRSGPALCDPCAPGNECPRTVQ